MASCGDDESGRSRVNVLTVVVVGGSGCTVRWRTRQRRLSAHWGRSPSWRSFTGCGWSEFTCHRYFLLDRTRPLLTVSLSLQLPDVQLQPAGPRRHRRLTVQDVLRPGPALPQHHPLKTRAPLQRRRVLELLPLPQQGQRSSLLPHAIFTCVMSRLRAVVTQM